MRKRLAAVLALVVVVAGACSKADKSTATGPTTVAKGAQTLPIGVDAKTPGFAASWTHFFPHTLQAHPGDTLEFTSHFTGEPHTVAFGTLISDGIAAHDRIDPKATTPPPPDIQAVLDKIPFLFTDNGGPDNLFNQAGSQPCYLATAEPPTKEACPQDKQVAPKEITGKERFLNTGFLADGKVASFKLSPAMSPGLYTFMCLVHGPEMTETVTVINKDITIPGPDAVAAEGRKHLDEFVGQVKATAANVQTSTSDQVPAGAVSPDKTVPSASINVFPTEVSVKAGEKLTWTVNGFHVIAFNAPEDARPWLQFDDSGALVTNKKSFEPAASPALPSPPAPAANAPPNAPPPQIKVDAGAWDGQGFHSSGAPFSDAQLVYSLAFTTPGTYKYLCLVHPDMEGTVKVT